MKILISTGEVSGDIVGGLLTREIRAQCADAVVFGIGGACMANAGAIVRFNSSHLGTVGVSEAFHTLPDFVRAAATLRRIVRDDRPDVAVLIGNDVFHVLLGRWLRSCGVPTIAYFPPQTWIWRSLARWIAGSFDVVFASFPDEQVVYRRASPATEVIFVGHYLSDALRRRTSGSIRAARERLGIPDDARVVGVLPGSRGHELRKLLSTLIDTTRLLADGDPTLQFLVPVAHDRYRLDIAREVVRVGLAERVTILSGPSHDAMVAADLLILASGTASLEATLLGVPMIIVYKVSLLTYGIVRLCIRLGLIDSDIVGLPNLILGRRAVPELIQQHATAPAIAAMAADVLSSPGRQQEILAALAEAARHVSGGDTLARAVRDLLDRAAPRAAETPARPPVVDAVDGVMAGASTLDAPVPESK